MSAVHAKPDVEHSPPTFRQQLSEAARKTATFMKNNGAVILASVGAWAVIIFFAEGLTFHFTATSLKLSIGMGCGFALGVCTGIASVLLVKPKAKKYRATHDGREPPWLHKASLWGVMTAGLNMVGESGSEVRTLVVTVAVGVVLAVASKWPTSTGVVFGVFIGNHLATRIGFGVDLGKEDHKKKIDRLEKEVDLLKQVLDNQDLKKNDKSKGS